VVGSKSRKVAKEEKVGLDRDWRRAKDRRVRGAGRKVEVWGRDMWSITEGHKSKRIVLLTIWITKQI